MHCSRGCTVSLICYRIEVPKLHSKTVCEKCESHPPFKLYVNLLYCKAFTLNQMSFTSLTLSFFVVYRLYPKKIIAFNLHEIKTLKFLEFIN